MWDGVCVKGNKFYRRGGWERYTHITKACMLDLVWMVLEGNGTNEPWKQVQIGANIEFVKCNKIGMV